MPYENHTLTALHTLARISVVDLKGAFTPSRDGQFSFGPAARSGTGANGAASTVLDTEGRGGEAGWLHGPVQTITVLDSADMGFSSWCESTILRVAEHIKSAREFFLRVVSNRKNRVPVSTAAV